MLRAGWWDGDTWQKWAGPFHNCLSLYLRRDEERRKGEERKERARFCNKGIQENTIYAHNGPLISYLYHIS